MTEQHAPEPTNHLTDPFAGFPVAEWPVGRDARLDVESSWDTMKTRLQRVGADAEEIAEVGKHWWDDGDDGWGDAERERVLGMSDADLVAEVLSVRAEAEEMGLNAGGIVGGPVLATLGDGDDHREETVLPVKAPTSPVEAPEGGKGTDTPDGPAVDVAALLAKTIPAIEDEVGDDSALALAVRDAEAASEKPRVTLVAAMDAIVAKATAPEA